METPFHQHIGTNYVPTTEETRQIQDLVNSSARELRDTEIEIEQVQQQLDVLHDKQLKIKKFKDQHEALISPARKLTRDILECIFLACLPGDANPTIDVTAAPILLTRICSSWRTVSLSTPRLWVSIDIVLPIFRLGVNPVANAVSLQEQIVHRTMTRLQIATRKWLDRSGACPLSISLSTASMEWGIPARPNFLQPQLDFFRNIILPYHQRWYKLDLDTDEIFWRTLVEAGHNGELNPSIVQELNIALSYGSHGMGTTSTLKDIFSISRSNKLTSLALHGVSIDFTGINAIPVNYWEGLTVLDVDLFYTTSQVLAAFENAAAIIRCCQYLQSLTLNAVTDAYDFQEDRYVNAPNSLVESRTLKHLRTLCIVLPPITYAVFFAQNIDLPLIEELDFQFSTDGTHRNAETVESIIKSLLRISHNFHTLRLFYPKWMKSTGDIVQVLKAVPVSAKRLMIHSNCARSPNWTRDSSYREPVRTEYEDVLNDDLLEALAAADKDYADIICPHLELFRCNYHLLTGFTESGLKKFVNDRKTAHMNDDHVATIRQLHCFVNYYKGNEDTGEKVSMGAEFTIYFRVPECDAQSWPPLESEAYSVL